MQNTILQDPQVFTEETRACLKVSGRFSQAKGGGRTQVNNRIRGQSSSQVETGAKTARPEERHKRGGKSVSNDIFNFFFFPRIITLGAFVVDSYQVPASLT